MNSFNQCKFIHLNKTEKSEENIGEKGGGSYLEINVRDDIKVVEVWLTQEEKQDATLRKQLKPLYREYKGKNYLVAVFESGTRNLWTETGALLCYNKKRIARMEMEREKGQGTSMTM